MYKKFAIIVVLIYLSACEKSPVTRSSREVLKSYEWFLSEIHITTYNNDNNQLLKDTTVVSDNCELNSTLRFLNDTDCSKYIVCLGAPTEKQGKWQLTTDSLLTATIQVQMQYGTGFILVNTAIDEGKLTEIDNNHFKIKRIVKWSGGTPGSIVNYRDEIMATYKSR
jgi:hypothetical protein